MSVAGRMVVALDALDLELGKELAENLASGILLRFAILTDRDGNVATRVAAIPADYGAAIRAQAPDHARRELAEGLRATARALDVDAGADGGRVWSARELARIIGDLERSHRRASSDATLLELRIRLGHLGLPNGE